jgi:hypothetical protein
VSEPPAPTRRGIIGALLLVIGLVCCIAYRVTSGSEHHAFSAGAQPPDSVHLTAGNSYQLSVRGGVKALESRGANLTAPVCEWSVGGSASQALTVSPESDQTKATNVVATFIAPYTGNLHIDCSGWGGVYVDDADDSAGDTAGWLLVLGVITLTIGVGLGLSGLRASMQRESARRSARYHDQVETFVDVARGGISDDEVARPYGPDVLP